MHFLLLLLTSLAFAQNPPADQASDQVKLNPLNTPQEEQIRERARKRLYPGGQDEEDLKVQQQLPVASRKMMPATEAIEDEPSNSGDHD